MEADGSAAKILSEEMAQAQRLALGFHHWIYRRVVASWAAGEIRISSFRDRLHLGHWTRSCFFSAQPMAGLVVAGTAAQKTEPRLSNSGSREADQRAIKDAHWGPKKGATHWVPVRPG